MRVLAVLPVIARHTADICIPSILRPDSSFGIPPEDILVIDNSREGWAHEYGLPTYRDPDGHNLGVARSWNIGAQRVLDEGLDYLIIVSVSMMFGPILHTTWRKQMETFDGANVIECDGHSWHLIALRRSLFERVGLFDSNFYPAYFEQIDWCRRLHVLGLEGGWPRVWVNALSQGHALHNQMVSCPAQPLLDYYYDKWGGEKGHERYTQPWGDRDFGYFPEHSIPELAARYNLETWW